MNSKLKNATTDFLFDAILSLETKEDCYRFFEDLCTSSELYLHPIRDQDDSRSGLLHHLMQCC